MDQLGQDLDRVCPEMAFGMGDEGPKPCSRQAVRRREERARERAGPGLEQDPAAVPERDTGELVAIESVDRRLGHLTTRGYAHADSPARQLVVEARRALGELRDADVVVVTDMWCGADRFDPVALRLSSHRDRIVEIARAIVDPGEDVTVQVDHEMPESEAIQVSSHRLDQQQCNRRRP